MTDKTTLQILQKDTAWIKTPKQRAEMTLACKDADKIPRVKDAGKTKQVGGQDVQIMHNGIMVLKDGYQGEWESRVIEGLRGIHEPQEEKAYHEVIKRADPGGVMIELGSWWSYYSMWFLKAVKNSTAYCTEPDPENMQLGLKNAELNGFVEDKDIFFRAYASGENDGKKLSFAAEDGSTLPVVERTVDSMIAEEGIKDVQVLHFDIQGAELATLHGARQSIKDAKIRFVVISTHHYTISGDPNIHQKCIDFIKKNGGHIIAQHTILESCSGDGLIVASFDERDKDMSVPVYLQPTNDSLFRHAEADIEIVWKALEVETKAIGKKLKSLQSQVTALESDKSTLQHKLLDESKKRTKAETELLEIRSLRRHLLKRMKSISGRNTQGTNE